MLYYDYEKRPSTTVCNVDHRVSVKDPLEVVKTSRNPSTTPRPPLKKKKPSKFTFVAEYANVVVHLVQVLEIQQVHFRQ